MKLFIVRHGESTGDIEDRYGGDYDDPLTEEGHLGARQCAQEFVGSGIQIVFSSPRKRALEAAHIIAETLGVEVKVVDDLREWNRYGVLTGMVKAEAKEIFPDEVARVGEFDQNTVSESESYADLKSRVTSVFKEVSNMPYQTAIAISHGGVIKCFAKECLGIHVAKYHDYGYFEVEGKDGEYRFINKVRYDLES